MHRRYINKKASIAEINLTPMIDVVFILLIFFILTASLNRETVIEIDKPSVLEAHPLQQKHINVTIASDKKIYFENTPVTLQELKERLTQHANTSSKTIVLMRVDRLIPTEKTISVLESIRLAGIEDISIATEGKAL